MKTLSMLALSLYLVSCSTVTIDAKAISLQENKIKTICIQKNPKVAVSDFLDAVEHELAVRGIDSKIYLGVKPRDCQFSMEYTAFRDWDIKPYMDRAIIKIRKNNKIIGSATFNQGYGFGFSKFDSTAKKLGPVFERLFGEKVKVASE